jgi:hypothetical protein
MRRIVCLFVLAFAVALVPAMADTWSFSYTSLVGDPISVSGSGTFTTGTPYGDGWLPITSITGTTNSAGDITGLYGPSVDPPNSVNTGTFQYDNAFSPVGDPLTNNGLLFNVSDALFSPINVFGGAGASGGDYEYSYGQTAVVNGVAGYYSEPVSFSAGLVSTPEPGVMSLLFAMLAGVGGVAGVLRKKLT